MIMIVIKSLQKCSKENESNQKYIRYQQKGWYNCKSFQRFHEVQLTLVTNLDCKYVADTMGQSS